MNKVGYIFQQFLSGGTLTNAPLEKLMYNPEKLYEQVSRIQSSL